MSDDRESHRGRARARRGFPATTSSATDVAPARHNTRSAPLIRRGHIFDKRRHARSVDTVRPIPGKHALQIKRAGLMPDFDPGLRQPFQAGEDHGIDGFAPWLPPMTNRRRVPGCPTAFFPDSTIASRTGLPVSWLFSRQKPRSRPAETGTPVLPASPTCGWSGPAWRFARAPRWERRKAWPPPATGSRHSPENRSRRRAGSPLR